MNFTLRNMYTIIMNWGWLRGYDNGDFEDGDNADNFMGPLGILLYQMRYSGRCSVFYIELLLEDIDWEGGQNSNHIVVGFPTSGWVSNQWLEIHPWWVNFQPFTLVGLDAVVCWCRWKIQIYFFFFHRKGFSQELRIDLLLRPDTAGPGRPEVNAGVGGKASNNDK